jgi:rfaE bifunctional protein kinase chain/domain
MNQSKINSLPDFSDLHLCVIGDVMIDRYINGKIQRISPEAPVPIVEILSTENRLGGASNVALNLSALGAKVTILSITGDDEDGILIGDMCQRFENIETRFIKSTERKTTVKTRVMANDQHVIRLDDENVFDISKREVDQLAGLFSQLLENQKIDGVILQDYNKGLLTKELIKIILERCNEKEIASFVDPKEKNFFEYKHCTFFKPNKKEVFKAFNKESMSLFEIDLELRDKLKNQITFITLGSQGIFVSDGKESNIFPTFPRSIADVCGAGDTVISIASLCYLKKYSLSEIAFISNISGGQVCEQPGVVAINKEALNTELSRLK